MKTMTSILERAAALRRHAARKIDRQKDKAAWHERKTHFQYKHRMQVANHEILKSARKRLREDYALGPLAPRRDVGIEKERWGTMPREALVYPEVPKEFRPKLCPFAAKDRVCVVAGRAKGTIATIGSVDEERQTAYIEGKNPVYLHVEEWRRKAEGSTDPIRLVDLSFPFSDLRLVHPLRLEGPGGPLRDAIINEFECRRIHTDKRAGTYEDWRIVYGKNKGDIIAMIPFPEIEKPEEVDQPSDTLRILVDMKTFVPTLRTAWMPLTVIDELRNKYSMTRKVHDPEYIEKKMELEKQMEEAKKQEEKSMSTPTVEAARKRIDEARLARAEAEANNKAEVMQKLSEIMLQRQGEQRLRQAELGQRESSAAARKARKQAASKKGRKERPETEDSGPIQSPREFLARLRENEEFAS